MNFMVAVLVSRMLQTRTSKNNGRDSIQSSEEDLTDVRLCVSLSDIRTDVRQSFCPATFAGFCVKRERSASQGEHVRERARAICQRTQDRPHPGFPSNFRPPFAPARSGIWIIIIRSPSNQQQMIFLFFANPIPVSDYTCCCV